MRQQQFGGFIEPFRGAPYQYGGYIHPFAGASFQHGGRVIFYRRQSGSGVGDVLRNIVRFVVPIVAPAAIQAGTTFLSKMAQSKLNKGLSWKDSAKQAIQPALAQGLDTLVKNVNTTPFPNLGGKPISSLSKATTSGSGRHRRKRKHKTAFAKKIPRTKSGAPVVYKGGKKRKNIHRRKKRMPSKKHSGGRKRRKSHKKNLIGGRRKKSKRSANRKTRHQRRAIKQSFDNF